VSQVIVPSEKRLSRRGLASATQTPYSLHIRKLEFIYMRLPTARRDITPTAAGLLLLWLVSGCAGSHRNVTRVQARPTEPLPAATSNDAPPEQLGVYHTVGPGETLWRIAKVYGLNDEELARSNAIQDPTRLEVGDRLFIPGARERLEIPAYPAPLAGLPTAPGPGDWLWPVADGRVLSYFGATRRSHRHAGVDILGRRGDRVLAANEGLVVYSGSSMHGYGKTIIIDHGDGLSSLYAHNSTLLVGHGQRVRRGQPIARVGRTGNATTDHCHFEIRRNDVAVDPLGYVVPSIEARR
jgi:murein DD-endopeptidase MepM/ murein hydrolase activator NlpD